MQRDVDKLENWASTNHMKHNNNKCLILHLGRRNPGHTHCLGDGILESNPEQCRGELCMWIKIKHGIPRTECSQQGNGASNVGLRDLKFQVLLSLTACSDWALLTSHSLG